MRPLAALQTDGLFCGLFSHYKLMGRFAALGHTKNGGPLCGPFPIFSKHPVYGEFTLNHKKISKLQCHGKNNPIKDYSLNFAFFVFHMRNRDTLGLIFLALDWSIIAVSSQNSVKLTW